MNIKELKEYILKNYPEGFMGRDSRLSPNGNITPLLDAMDYISRNHWYE